RGVPDAGTETCEGGECESGGAEYSGCETTFPVETKVSDAERRETPREVVESELDVARSQADGFVVDRSREVPPEGIEGEDDGVGVEALQCDAEAGEEWQE